MACIRCGKRFSPTMVRMAIGRLAVACAVCASLFVGLDTGGVYGPTIQGPDDTLGYGDDFTAATASGNNTRALYGYYANIPGEVRTIEVPDDQGILWVTFPLDEPPDDD